MLAVVQRVSRASVTIKSKKVAQIGHGLLVLLGVRQGDSEYNVQWLAEKIVNLRIFNDDQGKMNKSLIEIKGEMLVVSQFTLLGDCRKGRRPSFIHAAGPDTAVPLYEQFINNVQSFGISIGQGVFGAMMDVALVNDGPVTLIVESPP